MELSDYGVTLERLTEDKIELVRKWRNDPKISSKMFFRDEITPEMQRKWYHSVDNENNYYFLVVYKGEEIGLINVKDIDYETGCGEGGIFIYEDRFLCTDIAYRAHLVLFDYMFNILGLSGITSHIRDDNPPAIRFCLFLGGYEEKAKRQDDSGYYMITSESYRNNTNRIRFVERWNKQKSKQQ